MIRAYIYITRENDTDIFAFDGEAQFFPAVPAVGQTVHWKFSSGHVPDEHVVTRVSYVKDAEGWYVDITTSLVQLATEGINQRRKVSL